MTELKKLEEEYIKKCWVEVVGSENFQYLVSDSDGFATELFKKYILGRHEFEEKLVEHFTSDQGKKGCGTLYRPIKLKDFKLNNGWFINIDGNNVPNETGYYDVEVGVQTFLLYYDAEQKLWYRIYDSRGDYGVLDKYPCNEDMKWLLAWRHHIKIPKRLF